MVDLDLGGADRRTDREAIVTPPFDVSQASSRSTSLPGHVVELEQSADVRVLDDGVVQASQYFAIASVTHEPAGQQLVVFPQPVWVDMLTPSRRVLS